jgi:hypothetical protein
VGGDFKVSSEGRAGIGGTNAREDAKEPVTVEAARANMTPHIDGGRANEVEPRLEGAPDGAALIPGSPRGPGFSPVTPAFYNNKFLSN